MNCSVRHKFSQNFEVSRVQQKWVASWKQVIKLTFKQWMVPDPSTLQGAYTNAKELFCQSIDIAT